MPMDAHKKKVYTDVMETKLSEVAFLPSIAKGVFSGTIVRGGAVEILGMDAVNVGDYSGTITHQDMDGTKQTASINSQKYFSMRFQYGDLSQVPTNEISANTKNAVKALAKEVDESFLALASKSEVTVTGAIAKIKEAFVGLATAFDNANVDMGDRGVLLDPLTANTLADVLGTALNVERSAKDAYAGFVGMYMGIEIKKSNLIGKTSTVSNCIAYDKSAIVFPKSFDDVDSVNGVDWFGIAIRGLIVYGVDIIETNTTTNKSNRIIKFDIDHA